MQYIENIFGIKYNATTMDFDNVSSDTVSKIRTYIEKKQVVLLKGAFEKSSIIQLRTAFHKLMGELLSENPHFDSQTPNFFRRDIDPEKSTVKRTKQFVTSFYWNDDFFGEKKIFQALTRLRNRIAFLPLNYTIAGPEQDDYVTYPSIVHYPLNGGRLNAHVDPPSKQFCTIMLALSKLGEDFSGGGLYVIDSDDKKNNIDQHLDIGDVYLMNPAVIHGVETITGSTSSVIDWTSHKGRWILFPALIEAKSLNGHKITDLKDVEKKHFTKIEK